MADKENWRGMLGPYRVLDLADEKGFLCGKLLGDLGADAFTDDGVEGVEICRRFAEEMK